MLTGALREVAGARAAAAVRREPHAVVLDLDPDGALRARADDVHAYGRRPTPARAGPRWPALRARRPPRRTSSSGPTRPFSRSSSRPPPTTVTPSRVTTKDGAKPRPVRASDVSRTQPFDQAGRGVRVAQVVHDLPDLPHRAVDVVERLVEDRGQLGGVHAAGRASSDGLQLQARREQLLDGEVVQVAGDALALVEQSREVVGVTSGGQLGGERCLRGERLRGGQVASARTGVRRPSAAGSAPRQRRRAPAPGRTGPDRTTAWRAWRRCGRGRGTT